MEEIWTQLRCWVLEGVPFALATVVEAARPSPRGVGSVLAVRADGEAFIGSVSAGCVESEVIEAARSCMSDGETRWLSFGPDSGFPWEVALSCGGRISVRVERFAGQATPEILEALIQNLDTQSSGLLVSYEGSHCLIDESGAASGAAGGLPGDLIEAARSHLVSVAETVEIDWGESRALLRVLRRPKRLFVVGAAHIAIHLVGFARSLGFETIVIDPREAYARADRFPRPPDQLVCAWPEEALESFRIGESDCVAAMTHDPKIDDPALAAFLLSPAGYIGALGSRKSHAARLRRLGKAGFDPETLKRIHGPIGLDIGSETPAEIALSVMAEIVQIKNLDTK